MKVGPNDNSKKDMLQMTKDETLKLLKKIRRLYPNEHYRDLTEQVGIWHSELKDISYNEADKALVWYYSESRGKFDGKQLNVIAPSLRRMKRNIEALRRYPLPSNYFTVRRHISK